VEVIAHAAASNAGMDGLAIYGFKGDGPLEESSGAGARAK